MHDPKPFDDGGRAYPREHRPKLCGPFGEYDGPTVYEPGLTRWDHYFAAALTGLCAHGASLRNSGPNGIATGIDMVESAAAIATAAVAEWRRRSGTRTDWNERHIIACLAAAMEEVGRGNR